MSLLEAVYDPVLIVGIVCLMLSTGLAAEPSEIVSYFREGRLHLTLRVIAANLIVMPLATAIMLYFVAVDGQLALLLYLCAIAPAAPMIPVVVRLSGGDLDWSLALLFVLTAIGLVTIPPLIYLGAAVFPQYIGAETVSTQTLVIKYIVPVFLPLMASIALKLSFPGWASKLLPPVQIVFRYLLLVLIGLIFAINWSLFPTIKASIFFALLLFMLACAVIGWLSVYSLADLRQRITAAVSTAFRNFAVVLLLLTLFSKDHLNALYVTVASLVALVFCLAAGSLARRREGADQTR